MLDPVPTSETVELKDWIEEYHDSLSLAIREPSSAHNAALTHAREGLTDFLVMNARTLLAAWKLAKRVIPLTPLELNGREAYRCDFCGTQMYAEWYGEPPDQDERAPEPFKHRSDCAYASFRHLSRVAH